ncbi:hypothetical protein KIPB_008975 [Kipferlia bialata]|uniref:Dynactin subunit 5 n=1 Tax=Kipferlia bialata TaxID=797122 RepID=A0A9K3D0W0_9EUKA|nr:hypothetical protein KIPB_008975 [Kipferlia bialata]|eukprot:g8975.t1
MDILPSGPSLGQKPDWTESVTKERREIKSKTKIHKQAGATLHGSTGLRSRMTRFVTRSQNCVLHPFQMRNASFSSVHRVHHIVIMPGVVFEGPPRGHDVVLSEEGHVYIGKGAVIRCREIGSFVMIGDGVEIGANVRVSPLCRILPNTKVPDGMQIQPLCVVGGNPARVVGTLRDDSWRGEMMAIIERHLYITVMSKTDMKRMFEGK